MSITATELKMNLAKYLLLSATQDIFITKNGKVISKLTNPFRIELTLRNLFSELFPRALLWKMQKAKG